MFSDKIGIESSKSIPTLSLLLYPFLKIHGIIDTRYIGIEDKKVQISPLKKTITDNKFSKINSFKFINNSNLKSISHPLIKENYSSKKSVTQAKSNNKIVLIFFFVFVNL